MPLTVDLSWVTNASRTDGWSVLRAAVARRLGTDEVVLSRRCGACGSTQHGGPVLDGRPDVGLSISYATDALVVAVVEGAAVGVDVEASDADITGLATVALSPGEPATDLRRTWVRKEAVLKALGVGLSQDPAGFAVSDADAPPTVTWWGELEPVDLQLIDLESPVGLVGSLAVLSREPVHVRSLGM